MKTRLISSPAIEKRSPSQVSASIRNSQRTLLKLSIILAVSLLSLIATMDKRVSAQNPGARIGDRPTFDSHIKQSDIEEGEIKFKSLIETGEAIFAARWTKLDGQGRPAATGNGAPTKRDISRDPGFIRTSGTDSTSCADCHNQPTVGGAGGFVANVFVLAQVLDPVTDSVSDAFSDERNTLGMNGSGAIEMLAREMTLELQRIRESAVFDARLLKVEVTRSLDTKGVNFGKITARIDGTLDNSMIVGVDADLIIKPFHQKGVVNSVRVFTVNAYNHHHGMEAVERFGVGQKDNKGNTIATADFDEDGVPDEMSVGDITAATIFQAAMNIPGRVIPTDQARRQAADRGEARFASIGCADCHRPTLPLNTRIFSEPNQFNPPGNLRVADVKNLFLFDMTRDIPKPRLERTDVGGAIVRAFTDLKRHVICDEQDPFFCNERLIQSGVPTNQFITRKLWDVGNTAPYGHRGDLTTISEAIMHHAGEARGQRERFAALPDDQKAEIVEFLKQLQILPNGSPREVTEDELKAMLKSQKSVKSALLSGSATN
jgi:di-heme oxidoreductase (putative peroxidase)